jgi:hypothetical protein
MTERKQTPMAEAVGSQVDQGVGRTVDERWAIVPEAPTDQMMLAGEEAFAATARPGATWAEHTGAVYRAMLAAAPEPPHLSMSTEEARTFQRWEGMDGATAWHLIERHADGWGDVAQMMEAWLQANSKTPNVGIEPPRSGRLE